MSDKSSAPAPRALPRVIAIANQKGGVGKTTTTVNLASSLAEVGYNVLIVDLDPQGNASTAIGVDVKEIEATVYNVLLDPEQRVEDCIESTAFFGLKILPSNADLIGVERELSDEFDAHLRLKNALNPVVEDWELDFVLIDCPPALGVLTVNALVAATEVLVPVQCEGGFHVDALTGIEDLIKRVRRINPELEISTLVGTMFDMKTKLSSDVYGDVLKKYGDKVCRNKIPRSVRLAEAVSHGQPINVYDPTSKGSIAYRLVAKEVAGGATPRSR